MLHKDSSFSGLIQIAGVHDVPEARLLADCGVHCMGLPLRLPVNKEDITESDACKLIAKTRAEILSVCITYLDNADEIAAFCSQLGTHHVQLHGAISLSELEKLTRIAPQLYIIKSLVIHADGSNKESLLNAMQAMTPFVDAFITDSHNPETGADGATGLTHDWSISAMLVQHSVRPVILAGGLTPDNVAEAIRTVHPAGVDAHTGVEDETGRKNRTLVTRFVREATAAFNTLHS